MSEEIRDKTTEEADAEQDIAPIIPIRLQNIVATVNLGERLELTKITQTVRNAEYNPTRFQAVIMRIREPKATGLVFSTGKLIITGAQSEKDCLTAAKKFTAIIHKVGFPVSFKDYRIQNMTASCDAGFPIRLEGLIFAHSSCATYEPELFPGLVYRMPDPKVVLLIFVSGKIVLTGAKSEAALTAAFENIFPILLEFRKKTVSAALTR